MFIFLIISLRIPNLMPCNKGAYRNKSGGGGKICPNRNFFCPPPLELLGGHNLNHKFKTFGFLDNLKVHIHYTVQLPYKDYFISPSNKTSKKTQKINVFNTLHSSDQKNVITLSSRGGATPLPFNRRQGRCPPCPPLYALENYLQ